MQEMPPDELGEEIRRLLKTFYSAADPREAAAVADQILAKMQPFLKRWAKQWASVSRLQSSDRMADEEDFYGEAQAKLLDALHKSRHTAPIDNLLGYSKTLVANLCRTYMRSSRIKPIESEDALKDVPDPHSFLADFLDKENNRQICREGWKAIARCGVSGRIVILLALTQAEIHAWVGLPDPCPALAEMMEKDEASARKLWSRVPLTEKEIADLLKTSISYVQKLRSLTKEKLRNIVFPPPNR